MPNWVYNTLTIEGSPDLVNQVRTQLNSPFSKLSENWNPETMSMKFEMYDYSNPVFAFWNIIKPTDMVEYQKQSNATDSKLDWYTWNVNNWGCKWDIAVSNDDKYPNTQLVRDEPNGENHVLVYSFDTPWGVPVYALMNLSSQYPTLLFTNSYEEETGWGGEDEYLRGEHIEGASYNWQCKECDYMELNEPPYCETCEFDMCPSCGYGEPMDEDRVKCQTHMVLLKSTEKAEA